MRANARVCAVSVVGHHKTKEGRVHLHHVDHYDATDREDAEAQGLAYCKAIWPDIQVISILVEPVPGSGRKRQ